jgi:hypothetical protein
MPLPDEFAVPLGNIVSVANVTDIGGAGLDCHVKPLHPDQAPLRRMIDTTGGNHEIIDVNLEPID